MWCTKPSNLLVALLVAVALPACGDAGGEVTVRGEVTDQVGSQQARSVGGAGTVEAAVTARASAVSEAGALEVLAEGDIAADGSWELEVPSGQHKVVIEALDASGEAVAAAILETTGDGDDVTCTPIDAESSLEAQVFLAMVAQGVAVAEADAIDLRSRIDQEVAAEVLALVDAGGDGAAEVEALAEAVAAAQATEIRAYADAGVQVTQASLFEAELAASQTLSAALDAGGSAEDAYAAFFAALRAAAEAEGADAPTQGEAESQAGLAFRLVIDGRLGASGVGDASSRAAASLEARASTAAVKAILAAGGAASDAQAQGEAAGAALSQELSVAADAGAAAAAWAEFETAVVGGASVEGSVLGTFVGADLVTALAVDASLAVAANAALALEATAQTGVQAALAVSGAVDPEAVATEVVDAYGTFRAATTTTMTQGLATFGERADAGASLSVVAMGSFRAVD